jgi:hypothetical protein
MKAKDQKEFNDEAFYLLESIQWYENWEKRVDKRNKSALIILHNAKEIARLNLTKLINDNETYYRYFIK